MTIDERLEFLVKSTESLHATAQEHEALLSRLDAREAQHRAALLAAMSQYVDGLQGAIAHYVEGLRKAIEAYLKGLQPPQEGQQQ